MFVVIVGRKFLKMEPYQLLFKAVKRKGVEIDPLHVKGTAPRECFGCVWVFLVCNCVWVGGECKMASPSQGSMLLHVILEADRCIDFLASCLGVQKSANEISHILTLWQF